MNRETIVKEFKFFGKVLLIGAVAIGYTYFFDYVPKKNKQTKKIEVAAQKQKRGA